MLRQCFGFLLAASLLLAATAAQAEDTATLLAQYKSASGGAAWDKVKSLHATGTLSTGGLSGDVTLVQDIVTGRSADQYKLGAIEGADGYDGTQAWTRDPGGEVAAQDAPEAKRRARSQAWLDARGFWYPERIRATYGAIGDREADGKRYRVIQATPQGGDALTLWFDASSGLPRAHGAARRAGHDDDRIRRLPQCRRRAPAFQHDQRSHRRGGTHRSAQPHRDPLRLGKAQRRDRRRRFRDAGDGRDRARIDDAGGVAHIHFDLVNNHIYADGAIDGKPARFLVDTGGMNLLTPAAAEKFGIVGEGKLAGRGVGDEEVEVSIRSWRRK